jgi:hypothetical protein
VGPSEQTNMWKRKSYDCCIYIYNTHIFVKFKQTWVEWLLQIVKYTGSWKYVFGKIIHGVTSSSTAELLVVRLNPTRVYDGTFFQCERKQSLWTTNRHHDQSGLQKMRL